jgi:hypothetical protein
MNDLSEDSDDYFWEVKYSMFEQTDMGAGEILFGTEPDACAGTVSSRTSETILPLGLAESSAIGKYGILDIACWFLHKEAMSHRKLQKLCYYAQAWFFTLENIRLTDAIFEAWIHGPVSPSLYQHFKKYGCKPPTTLKR